MVEMNKPGWYTIHVSGSRHGGTVLSNLYHVKLRSQRDGEVYALHVAASDGPKAVRKAQRFLGDTLFDVLTAERAGSVIL